MNEPLHFVTFTLESGGHVTSNFICRGGPLAECHSYPDDAEEWYEGDGQLRVSHDECWAHDWLEGGDLPDYYAGPTTTIRDGAIEVVYTGDGVEWTYREERP